MIFLRLARFFQRFRVYVCPAFSAPGFRSGVQMIKDTLFDGLLSIRENLTGLMAPMAKSIAQSAHLISREQTLLGEGVFLHP
jgi:hypothetical protein